MITSRTPCIGFLDVFMVAQILQFLRFGQLFSPLHLFLRSTTCISSLQFLDFLVSAFVFWGKNSGLTCGSHRVYIWKSLFGWLGVWPGQNFCSHCEICTLERIQLRLQQCCRPDIKKAFPGVELSLMGLVIGRNQNVSKNLRVSHHHVHHTHHTPMLRNTGCCLFSIGNILKILFGVLGVWPGQL
jgi:hypothetical protein